MITVALAVTRYFIIVRPIQTRAWITVSGTVRLMIIIFIVGIISNIPHFFIYDITKEFDSKTNKTRYRLNGQGNLLPENVKTAYDIAFFIVFIVFPICILVYCNTFIVRELYNSRDVLKKANVAEPRQCKRTNNIVNIVLIVMILQHIACVLPAEAMGFIKNFINTQVCIITYNKVIAIVTVIELCGFAFNCLIYSALNAHYRQFIASLFKHLRCPPLRRQSTSSVTTNTISLRLNEGDNRDDLLDEHDMEMNEV